MGTSRTGRVAWRLAVSVVVPLSISGASTALAQTPTRAAGPTTSRGECPAIATSTPPSEIARRSARELAARAQEAAIVEDNATARDLYRRAAVLDPTDPTTAYALARAYEAAHDVRAIGEYCRFLALSPTTPDSADVRRRIAALSYELLPRTASAGATAGVRRPLPVASAALAYGLLFPGSGQYYTHRPVAGLLATTVAAGALVYGFRPQTTHTPVTKTGVDPFGNSYEYQDVASRTSYPHMAAGLAAAAGVSLVAAIEAYSYAHHLRAAAPSRRADAGLGHGGTTFDVVALPVGVGLALRVPVAPSR